jgi:hypothetical protein
MFLRQISYWERNFEKIMNFRFSISQSIVVHDWPKLRLRPRLILRLRPCAQKNCELTGKKKKMFFAQKIPTKN